MLSSAANLSKFVWTWSIRITSYLEVVLKSFPISGLQFNRDADDEFKHVRKSINSACYLASQSDERQLEMKRSNTPNHAAVFLQPVVNWAMLIFDLGWYEKAGIDLILLLLS